MLQLIVLRNSRGVTLIEVLIAMTVLLIVFMGLIQASIVAIGANTRNEIRDEAARFTSELMTRLRSAPFEDLDGVLAATPAAPDPASFTVNPALTSRTIRNATVSYTVGVVIASIDADHKQITINTTWTWQGETMTHSISAFRGRS
ncbi:MAG: prepilin-type N-terminal cleavage/methylation domain-containing protein [Nitrospirae bacterium]|nr:prepilin-type N-terminal cleavage/methylation domain-containing protein [Nitrospirota bacterium]